MNFEAGFYHRIFAVARAHNKTRLSLLQNLECSIYFKKAYEFGLGLFFRIF
ncbi:hypothetical protein LEP1GSC186_1198 [Leptospira noguchii serovar Autumnalis str. ZUN142]|uniref:Uncharacterized protein n=1 Tax=Leptospira noguchii serovar Autumnalis str. ZUN142 TaxID=1085540 RepID=M6U8T0_9LEPT|nr:hypothetical protein LEP1GSC186_1198 [Leptospira noguchii serovar Autumnalis str. ZUN142]